MLWKLFTCVAPPCSLDRLERLVAQGGSVDEEPGGSMRFGNGGKRWIVSGSPFPYS